MYMNDKTCFLTGDMEFIVLVLMCLCIESLDL